MQKIYGFPRANRRLPHKLSRSTRAGKKKKTTKQSINSYSNKRARARVRVSPSGPFAPKLLRFVNKTKTLRAARPTFPTAMFFIEFSRARAHDAKKNIPLPPKVHRRRAANLFRAARAVPVINEALKAPRTSRINCVCRERSARGRGESKSDCTRHFPRTPVGLNQPRPDGVYPKRACSTYRGSDARARGG